MAEGENIDGIVSLWVGHANSAEAMDVYTEMDYLAHAKDHLSPFAIDFGTGWYDHDFMDAYVRAGLTRSLPDLLRGCSYDAVVIPKFIKLCGEFLPEEANAVVLLYKFRHRGTVGPNAAGAVRLRYMGSIKVDMPWPD